MSAAALTEEGKVITLSAKEERLLEELHRIGWGEIRIRMVDGQPDTIIEVRAGTRL